MGSVLLPGDIIPDLQESEATKKTILGPGLRFEGDDVYATKPGILKFREPNVYWIDAHQWRVKTEMTLTTATLLSVSLCACVCMCVCLWDIPVRRAPD